MDDRATQQVVYGCALGLVEWATLAWVIDATSWSTGANLTVVGGTLELTGFVLVTMDFWRPWITRANRAARDAISVCLSRAGQHLDALRGRSNDTYTFGDTLNDRAIPEQAMDEIAATRHRVSFPAVRAALVEHESRLNHLESRLVHDVGMLESRIDAVTQALQAILERDRNRYIGWRIVGLLVAFAGVLVLTAANLV